MFAQIRSRKQPTKTHGKDHRRSVLRAGRAGAQRGEWILEAIQQIREADSGVERIGVWLEGPPRREGTESGPLLLRGEVWEEGIGTGPPEWSRISGVAPIPIELLNQGLNCEYEVRRADQEVILGPLLELQRVLWVPVVAHRVLRGLVMLGTRQKQRPLPHATAEQVADELGMVLEFEEARQLAEMRKADLELYRRVEAMLAEGQNANMVLGQVAESCTRGSGIGGVGAVFTLIGERRVGMPVAAPSHASDEERLLIRAHSGDAAWIHGVHQGPLETLWRQAVESQRVTGAEADLLPMAKNLSRIVAIPLRLGNETAGVLVAGLPRRKTSLENLERLELRARLAAEVLEKERRAERGLQQESWHKALLESSEEPVVLVDRRGFLAGMSQGASKLARLPFEALEAGKSTLRFAELFRPRDWERVQEWAGRRFQGQIRTGEEAVECELAAGEAVTLAPLAVSGHEYIAVRLEARKGRNFAHCVEDVQAELKETLQWLEEGVALFNEGGEIVARNTRFLQILGFTEEQGATLRTLEDVIEGAAKNASDPESFAANWRALAHIGMDGAQEELSFDRPVPHVMERIARPILNGEGRNLGRVEVYRETTTRRLFQSRMVQAEKLAMVGQRVMGIMHEFSNPLTTILGTAQRIILRNRASEPSEEAHRIVEEAERASAILRQLLYLSRDARPERRLLSVNELAEQAMELQRMSHTGHAIQYKLETTGPPPRVEGDMGQLQQVLLNLLQNAQQAIEQSGKGGTIGLRTSIEEPGQVRVEVWDDGPGIPETLHARIFDPFFTTKPPAIGTGLGLTIVSGFVRQHGGRVTVMSRLGEGARFIVELPAAKVPSETGKREGRAIFQREEMLSAPRPTARRSGAGENGKAPHILVVEDEPTVASLIADVLREEGMCVDVLPDGRSALDAARERAYDLAICDLKMPGVDGQVFYKTLVQRQSPLREHVLFVTGDVLAPRIQEFLEQHHLPHVAKPFRVEELSLAVRKMLWGDARAAVS